MSGRWAWVPFMALGCYLYLLLALMAAKKNRAIHAFMILICAMILWTEGSLMMRLLVWPGYEIWYHISVFGLLLVVLSFYYCVSVFLDIRSPRHLFFWLGILLSAGILNMLFGCFAPAPSLVIGVGGGTAFVYSMTPAVLILFLICLSVVIDTIRMYRSSSVDSRNKYQLFPLFVGFAGLIAGHAAICIPAFSGIPLDVMAGVFNAVCIFYALYRKRLLRLTLFLSRNNCYLAATALTMFLLSNSVVYMELFIKKEFPRFGDNSTVVISVIFVITTLVIYEIARYIIDKLFVKDETVRTEKLREYCFKVSQKMDMQEILQQVFQVITENTPAEQIYACMKETDGYHVFSSGQVKVQKERRQFSGVLISYLEQSKKCITMRELEHLSIYREMGEKEKAELKIKKIGCLVPLEDGTFTGFLAIVKKSGREAFRYEDIAFLESVESIASMALKNAKLYENARVEARTDELTGIYNRRAFYEILEESCKEGGSPFILLLLNLDDFKLFNQLYGVGCGDRAICEVARILREFVQDSCAARYGGKEFAVILPEKTEKEAKNLAAQVLTEIKSMKVCQEGQELNILTASCGICSWPDCANSAEELLAHAEMAVYLVKQRGKNGVIVYREGQEQGGGKEKEKEEIYSSYASMIFALTAAIDTKDHYTFNHSQNVAYYATGLAHRLKENEDFIEMLREAALLHDVGKIGIPEDILNKPGVLTDEEYAVIQTHVENSIGIIRHLPSLNYVIPAVICHHERYDGAGYPRRISGELIPLSGRILCIADSFDAMVSKRSYKVPYPLEKVIGILIEEKGRQFDPDLVDVFIAGIEDGTIEVQ